MPPRAPGKGTAKAKAKPKPKGTSSSRAAAALPQPIHTPTVQLLPSQPIGFAIQHQLFLCSEQWITPLHRDVNALLNAFEWTWTARSASASTRSPFELFKDLWTDKGWAYVHLLGVADGPMRVPWGESVLRAFAEHLTERETPLRQIGALFAIYTFCKTQSSHMPRQFVKLDIPTLNHLLSFPSRVSPALDPTGSSPLSPPPGTDVATVLDCVLAPATRMFHLVPTELALHPKDLPTVLIRDARARDLDAVARKLLGVEEETEWLRRGKLAELDRVRTRERVKSRRLRRARDDGGFGMRNGDDDPDEEDEDEDGAAGRDEGEEAVDVTDERQRARGCVGDWIDRLAKVSKTYSAVKRRSQALAAAEGGGPSVSVLARPRSKLQLEVLNKAEHATMAKVVEAGLEQTVKSRIGRDAARPERGETDQRLLHLVAGFDAPGPRGKRKRERNSQAMQEFETAVTLLDKSSVYE
ncbi:hypothetical protein JCM11491_006289 [Sporobolomyces phaffii]